MNQLDHGAETYGALSPISRVSSGKQQQCRTQALAAPAQKIAGDFRDRLKGGLILQPDFLLDLDKVVADQIENFPCGQK